MRHVVAFAVPAAVCGLWIAGTFLLALWLLTGCSAPVDSESEPGIAFGTTFACTPELEQDTEVRAAFDEWASATGGSAWFELSPTGDWVLAWAPFASGMGRLMRNRRRIELNSTSEWPEDWKRRLVLHELGHAMGLEHGDGSLMEEHVGDCIDEQTLAVLCETRECADRRPTCPKK